jgi:hypothetical protein
VCRFPLQAPAASQQPASQNTAHFNSWTLAELFVLTLDSARI